MGDSSYGQTVPSYFAKKLCSGGVFTLLHRLSCPRKSHNGGILIEFAFSIPVCISLLFFVNDHYRFYELKNKARTSAYLAASLTQQIKNNKTDKTLTKGDLARIAFASCLNFFHTKSMFNPWPFGIYYTAGWTWVKRINSDSYQYQACYSNTSLGTTIGGMNTKFGNLSTITRAKVEAINPDLVCNKDGEERVSVSGNYNKINDSYKSKLGFFILTPTPKDGKTLFSHQVVITPKPGLFPGQN